MHVNSIGKQLQIEKQKQLILDDAGFISLSKIFESTEFQIIVNNCRDFRNRIFTPLVTLLIFIKQVLSPDKSCKQAIADFIAAQSSKGNDDVPSSNTGPYCKARQRLPEKSVKKLVKLSNQLATETAPAAWRIYGREVKLIDGTTIKMADTAENQRVFPQQNGQQEGAGFPIARLIVMLSLTTGTVVDYAVDAYKGKGTGEQSLLRRIFNNINGNDILLGDRYFPCFFLLADLKGKGADGIFRGQSQRNYDFRKGEKLGKNDHIVDWKKPKKPTWMDQKTYDAYPKKITIREFKVNGNIYVTTFLNSKRNHKKELAKIYKLRWQIEISLDSIKTVMQMDMLSCKTPEMVRKEIGIHFLAYNFIRILMAEACQKHWYVPREISFKGTIQLLNAFSPYFVNSTQEKNEEMYLKMLALIVKNKVSNRPNRVEPRLIKQRGKPFNTLKKPRNIEREKIKKQIEKRVLKYATA